MLLLSYPIESDTPTYGDRNRVVLSKTSNINAGDPANDTYLSMTVHSGTHIDLPRHFYANGQVWNDFDLISWHFNNPVLIDLKPESQIISDQLTALMENIENKEDVDIILVKTGFCYQRKNREQILENYGFTQEVADYIRYHFPSVRAFGFDTLSVSSFSNRPLGRIAHRAFLNPDKPILLIEDMDLTKCSEKSIFKKIIIAPLFIQDSDALPCTIYAYEVDD